jgi:hypothetical protein
MEKDENEEKSANFSYQYTELLYLIYEGYKNGAFTNEEKSKIKELIILEHPAVFELLKKFHKDGIVYYLWKNLKDLVNEAKYEDSCNINNREKLIFDSPDKTSDKIYQISSPSDFALVRKKKIKTKTKKENQIVLEESNKENDSLNYSTNISDHSNAGDKNHPNDISIKICQQGNSPTILIKKNNY